ncbi:MAG: hypothetical protein QW819_05980 [Candidatus Korarchaeota archaeon]
MPFRILQDEFSTDSIKRIADDVYVIDRFWRPNREFYFIVEFDFEPTYWIIPGVIYDGNRIGTGTFLRPSLNSPYFVREDRCCIPSAGIVEDDNEVLAVFTEPRNEAEMTAVSVLKDKIVIRIPWAETPVSYTAKGRLSRPCKKYFSRAREYSRRFYIINCKYRNRGYQRGYHLVLDKAFEILVGKPEEITIEDLKGYVQSRISYALNVHYCRFFSRKRFVQFVLCGTPICGSSTSGGFVGRELDLALALYRVYLTSRDEELKEIAFDIANSYCNALTEDGMIYTDYFLSNGRKLGYAICHKEHMSTRAIGETLYSLLRLYEYSQKANESNKKWLLVPMRVCLSLIEKQLETGDYGTWLVNGKPMGDSTNGAYIVWPMVKLYTLAGEKLFLKSAEKAMRYYSEKFVKSDIYYRDTLDSDSIDKEGAHAILRAAILLYDATRNHQYVEIAERAAYFLSTWTFLWDVPFGKDSFLGELNFRTRGWTVVSVENQHLDPYGLIIAPDFLRLYQITRKTIWRDLAMLMAKSVLNFVFPLKSRGINRIFYGYQPEQINHTNWSYIPLLGTLHTLILFGKLQLKKKGLIANSVLWTASATVNSALDIAEILGADLGEFNLKRIKGWHFNVFKFLQKFFIALNVFI